MPRQLMTTLLLSVFIAMLGIGIIVPVMPILANKLGANGLALGLIIAAFSLAKGAVEPIVGSLSDRWGRKRFLACGLLILALVGLAMPAATSVADLLVIRAVHGVGSAMIVPVAMAYVGEMAPLGQEGRAMAMLNIAIFTGIGCGPLLGGLCTDLWGMAAPFHAMAGLSGLALFLVLGQMPAQGHKAAGPSRPGIGQALATMLRHERTAGILLARMATMMIMVPTMGFLPLLMHQRFAASAMEIGIVITSRTLINALFQTPFGRLADRRDKTALLRLGCLIVSAVMCLIPLAGNFWLLLGLFVVLGLGEAIIWPTLGALATEEGRRHGAGTMMGAFNLAMSSGIFCGSLAAGLISDQLGLGWSFFLIGLGVLALCLTATGLMRKKGTDLFFS